MKLTPETHDINDYLTTSDIIDFQTPGIQKIILEMSQRSENKLEILRDLYLFVRDEISHSGDIDNQQVTCQASEVLRYGHGICCAKSHLFAACARAIGVPTGFCYQKLITDETDPDSGFSLHGLNAVFLKDENRWVRLDARGNKEGVNAEYSIEEEKVAWPAREEFNELDYPVIYANPLNQVVKALQESNTRKELQPVLALIHNTIQS